MQCMILRRTISDKNEHNEPAQIPIISQPISVKGQQTPDRQKPKEPINTNKPRPLLVKPNLQILNTS